MRLHSRALWLICAAGAPFVFEATARGQTTGLRVTHHQVNVNALGQNIAGDAANEPSLCLDPREPSRVAVGWRQFNSVRSDFRQAGWAYSTNGGLGWTFPGVLEPGIFRSDPVLASDADGTFYYLGVLTNQTYHCDMFRSTNGGVSWEFAGLAQGGDKEWMAIDTTSGPGRGNIYQAWSPYYNFANNVNAVFSRSSDGGANWSPPATIPNLPYWGTLAVGPAGEVYMAGWDGSRFWVNRSSNARLPGAVPVFDLTVPVDLGGGILLGVNGINPVGLLGQPWVVVDNSNGPMRGNVYLLSTVTGAVDPTDVMFARSTDGATNWTAAMRLNDDVPSTNSYHWFGTLSIAPNGRLDACWYDTRHDPTRAYSELYFTCSADGGVTWSPNLAISAPFNHTLGYPVQRKIGDYIGMVSLNAGAFIAYSATFNGEEDIWFARVELPARVDIALSGNTVMLSWDTLPGRTYCVEATEDLQVSWPTALPLDCFHGTGHRLMLQETITNRVQRFYRVVSQP